MTKENNNKTEDCSSLPPSTGSIRCSIDIDDIGFVTCKVLHNGNVHNTSSKLLDKNIPRNRQNLLALQEMHQVVQYAIDLDLSL